MLCPNQITDIQHYVNVATGDLRLDLNSNGYEFFSLANKATQSLLGGVNGGIPFMQVNLILNRFSNLKLLLINRLRQIISLIQILPKLSF